MMEKREASMKRCVLCQFVIVLSSKPFAPAQRLSPFICLSDGGIVDLRNKPYSVIEFSLLVQN